MYAPTQSELREKLEALRSSNSNLSDSEPKPPPRSPNRGHKGKRTKVKMGYHTWTPGMLHDQLMAELKTREGTRCNCCPYGYHIHLDFVQFCDALKAQAAKGNLDQLRQLCKERRRQRKSLQAYLGTLDKEAVKQGLYNGTEEHVGKAVVRPTAPPPDLLTSNDETLSEVFRNFEDVLKGHENGLGDGGTYQRPTFGDGPSRVDLLRNAPKYADSPLVSSDAESRPSSALRSHWPEADQKKANEILDMVFGPSRSRSGSTSSISSQSTTSSHVLSDLRNGFPPTKHPPGLATSPTGPNSLGVNRAALTNVRELMATSLKRIRQLEDEVKAIPLLQVKLSVLKEEKRLLMLQLKAKSTHLSQRSVAVGDDRVETPVLKEDSEDDFESRLRALDGRGIVTPRITSDEKGRMSPLSFALSLDAALNGTFKDTPPVRPSRSLDRSKPLVRIQKTVGVGCSVETRTVGVGEDSAAPSQAEYRGQYERSPLLDAERERRPPRALPCTKCAERNQKQYESKQTATDTEVRRDVRKKLEQLTFDVCEPTSVRPELRPCSRCEERLQVVTSDSAVNTEVVRTSSVGVTAQARSPVPTPPVSPAPTPRPRSRSQGAQTTRVTKGNVGVQISPSPVRKRDVMLQADSVDRRHVGLQVRCEDVKAHVVSTGTGVLDVRDATCDRCRSVRRRSIGVGIHVTQRDVGVTSVVNEEKTSRGSGDCAVSDVLCEKCELRQTETIGVGDWNVNETIVCDVCRGESAGGDKSEAKPEERRTIGTTMTTSMEEARTDNAGVRLCDKCSSQITNVAKDFIDKNVLDPALPTLTSRIPKLASRSPRKVMARPTSMPLGFDNRRALMGSPEDKRPEVPLQPRAEQSRMTERAEKHEPSREVKAACKVLNDYLMKPERGDPNKLKTAVSLIQQEWFRIASPADSDPNVVEDYMDTFEEFSRHLLHRIVNMADVNGNTAIHYAVSHGNFDVVSILLDSKVCDVSKQNKAGYTCMMLVSLAEIKNDTHRLVVQRLFQLGDVNTKATQNGQTALMLAASHGRLEMVKLLLDAGSEPNVQDNDGSTALMCAAEHGYIEIVRALLAHPDTEVCLADNDGSTALTIAMEAGHKDTALLIYASSNFSRGSSPYSSLRGRKHVTPRSTPPPSRPPRTPPPPSPARSRRSSSSAIN
ncbi:uncharacterized protein LOC8040981 isoform X1 [Ixodes scapularis]|uniref:uncharacterized protein LOC8040981 isoform X1 n=1 Tax=Ixodes scapularis TaxID=6945 RepID=UPI001A9D3819|nr:uncharacterized protein LOC8040981 isoform X1 [Ixodes scapularis]